MSEEKRRKLEKLNEKLENDFQKLPLVKSKKDIVPPEGNPDAEIMFIGEAAGYHEHVQRRPFVGAAGKLLVKILGENGLKREDVWISNVVKTRPPQNRDPKPEEIDAYKPYLDKEIEIIQPKIIATLGRFSMAKFIPDVYISQIHGQPRWVNWEGKQLLIFPMYHPAAALRNGKVMSMFREDFNKLNKTLEMLDNKHQETEEEQNQQETEKQENKKNEQLELI